MRAVVIGGGLAGATCASSLQDAGLEVRVLDKARGAGGRASTRRADGVRFDHGASGFDVRAPAFAAAVRRWQNAGVVTPWLGDVARPDGESGPLGNWFVGVPGMSAIVRHASQGLSVRYSSRVSALTRSDEGSWTVALSDGEQLGPFDIAVLAIPAPQTIPLLQAAPQVVARLEHVRMDPCWSLLVHFARRPPRDWTAAFVSSPVFQWVSGEHTKPERSASAAWVAQATPKWSRAHVDDHPDAVRGLLLAHLGVAAGPLPPLRYATAHRWRYARTRTPLGEPYVLDEGLRLGVCGDWCLGDRLEDAYLSGLALARSTRELVERRSAS